MNTAADTLAVTGTGLVLDGGGFSWWQAIGATLLVLALLVLLLKLLQRLQRPSAAGPASVETIMPLGPRREIEVIRLGDRVHYVYRREGALAVLREESLEDFRASAPEAPADAPWRGWLNRIFGRGR